MNQRDPCASGAVERSYARSVLLLARDPRTWESLVAFDPVERRSVRLDTHGDEECWLLSWLPGQATSWHDHQGSAGSFVVIRGRLCEQIAPYRTTIDMDSPQVHTESTRLVAAGQQRSFEPQHLHRLVNTASLPAVSLHANARRSDEEKNVRREHDPDEWLMTPAEVAAFFRVNPKTVTRWSTSGKLTSVRTLGGHRRFLASEVRALRREEPG